MRFIKASAVLAAFGATLAACGAMPLPGGGEPAPLPDRPVSFENVILAEDGRSVRVDFVGGQEFDPDNPCSVAYAGIAQVVDEELEVGIFAEPHPKPLPPDTGCVGMGYPRALTLQLEQPFDGTVVRDPHLQLESRLPPLPRGALEFQFVLRVCAPCRQWQHVYIRKCLGFSPNALGRTISRYGGVPGHESPWFVDAKRLPRRGWSRCCVGCYRGRAGGLGTRPDPDSGWSDRRLAGLHRRRSRTAQ